MDWDSLVYMVHYFYLMQIKTITLINKKKKWKDQKITTIIVHKLHYSPPLLLRICS